VYKQDQEQNEADDGNAVALNNQDQYGNGNEDEENDEDENEEGTLDDEAKLEEETESQSDRASKLKYEEVDLDAGLQLQAQHLPEVGRTANRTKVLEALLQRGSSTAIWDRLPIDKIPWEYQDCPNPSGEQVDELAHGLANIVPLDGKIVPLARLPPEQRCDLRLVAQLKDVDPDAVPTFIPPWKDARLRELALDRSCTFFSSTSSLTGLLSKCFLAIDQKKGVDLLGLTNAFQSRTKTFSPSTRIPSLVSQTNIVRKSVVHFQ